MQRNLSIRTFYEVVNRGILQKPSYLIAGKPDYPLERRKRLDL